MRRRRLLAGLGTTIAVGVAGCGAPQAADESIPDREWIDGDELVADAIAENHLSTLITAGSFELVASVETSHDGAREPRSWLPSQTYLSRFDLDQEREYLRQEMTHGMETDVFELYADGSTVYIRQQDGEDVSTSHGRRERTTAAFREAMETEAGSGVRGLSGWNMRITDPTVTWNGESALRFEADEFIEDAGIPESVTDSVATMYATPNGVVPHLAQLWDGRHGGQTVTVDMEQSFQGIGETRISEPAWVSDI